MHPMFEDHIARLQAVVELPGFDATAAHRQMAMIGRLGKRPRLLPGRPRVGAVLCLLYPHLDGLHVLLTKRPDRLRDHSGQIAFPGGKVDAGETPAAAALRETCEEVGICSDVIRLIGPLTPIYIPPSDFEVHPFIGYAPQRPTFHPNPVEVELVLEPSLRALLDPHTRKQEKRTFPQWPLPLTVPYFDVDGHKVWGATAIMLSEFLGRWQQLVIDN